MSDSDSGNDNELPSNSGKLTVKGLPDHLKEGVRREQNRIVRALQAYIL